MFVGINKIQKESEITSISFIYQGAQNGWVQNIITGMKTTMREKGVTGKNRWYVKEEQYKIYTVGSTSMKVKSTINNEKVMTIAYNTQEYRNKTKVYKVWQNTRACII